MSEIALLGKKIGMTREFYKTGQLVPVTVLKMEKARVIQVISKEKRGYSAIQLGYGKIKNSKLKIIPKGKHLCSIECADDVNNAIKEHIKND